jgi:hypothetical protein
MIGLGFASHVIGAAPRRTGTSRLVTFDRQPARIENVELLEA